MEIHQIFDTKEEYVTFCNELFGWVGQPSRSLWKVEDQPKVEPYLKWLVESGRAIEMTPEEKASRYFYLECCRNKEIRDALAQFTIYDLCDVLGFECQDELDEYDEKMLPINIKYVGEFTFPMVVTGIIESVRFCCVRFVEKREFEGK